MLCQQPRTAMTVSMLGQHPPTAIGLSPCLVSQHPPIATGCLHAWSATTHHHGCLHAWPAPTHRHGSLHAWQATTHHHDCLHAWSTPTSCHWLSPCLVSNRPPPWLSPCLASTHPPPWLSPCLASNHLPPLLFSLRNPRVVPEMHSLTGWFAAAGSRPHVCYSNRDRARRTRTTTTRKFCQQAPFPRPGME
jgi:hypothetical protein